MPSTEPRFDLASIRRYVEAMPPERAQSAPKSDDRLTLASILALAAGNGADVASTVYALNRGAQEANPVYGTQPSAAKLLAIKGAGTAAQWLVLHKMAKSHPKIANAVAKVVGGANGALAVHNLRAAQQSTR